MSGYQLERNIANNHSFMSFKVLKSYYLLEPRSDCKQVSISVKVEGKVQYTGGWVCTTDYNSPGHKQEVTAICLHSPDHARL